MEDSVIWISRPATGEVAPAGSTVEIRYTIFLADQQVIEQSEKISYTIGTCSLCDLFCKLVAEMPLKSEGTFKTAARSVFGIFGSARLNLTAEATVQVHIEVFDVAPEQIAAEQTRSFDELKVVASNFKDEGNRLIDTDPVRSKAAYYRAINLFPSLASNRLEIEQFLIPFYLNSALCDIKSKNYNSAIRNCQLALERCPEHDTINKSKAYYRMGEALAATKEYQAARWHYAESYHLKQDRTVRSKFEAIGTLLAAQDKQREGILFNFLQNQRPTLRRID